MAAYNPFLSKKVKKSEFFSRYPLDFFPENSIIGFTLERDPQNGPDETEARETSGKIEGIGDMLSDGPRKFLGSQRFTENRTDYLKSMKSLILAQNERWWRVLYMQFERGSNA